MRIAVVGPTHPYKGGIAAHTTALAHHLAAAGHTVGLVSWSRLYPKRLYPGELSVPGGVPEGEDFPGVTYPLRWDSPMSWWRTGRRLRGADLLVVPFVVPAQVPALLAVLRAARAPAVVIAHNVTPHESHPGARTLTRALFRHAGTVLVHSAPMQREARELVADPDDGLHDRSDAGPDDGPAGGPDGVRVRLAELPMHLPGGVPEFVRRSGRATDRLSVLALGMVREYKGVDLLLAAAAAVPDVAVTVAGEQWGRAGAEVRRRAEDPRLAGRVRLQPGYVAAADIADLLREHDVLALPYRHATASQNVQLAFAHAMPVLASDTGTFGAQVRDGVDGVLVPPGDVAALERALARLAGPGVLERLQRFVTPPDLEAPWRAYLAVLLAGHGEPG